MATTRNSAQDERIRTRAFFLWEQDGRPLGREHEHWNAAALQIAREDRLRDPDGDDGRAQPLLSEPQRDGAGVDASRTGRTADGNGRGPTN